MRIALGIEYAGGNFLGWQSQIGGHTVQDTLQTALSRIAGMPTTCIAAGRTDTGVHAFEQVVHFDTDAIRPLSAWVRGVNSFLPQSIAVLWAHKVSNEFHARFAAQLRSYRYLLINRPVRSPLQKDTTGWFHSPLDIDKMQQSAQYLVGEHDFSTFRASECQANSPVKTLTELNIVRIGEMIIFDLSANAFLHHMVRNIVGTLIYVGKGKHPPQWARDILESRNRHLAAPTFAPEGLYLRRITYDDKWGLPHRSV